MTVDLSYGDVEATLARLNRIAEDKRVAFRARLKHFQRLGFPPGVNTGTGKRAIYTFPLLLMMAFATEFAQAGMAPKRIVKTLSANWNEVEWSLLIALTPEELFDRWTPSIDANKLVWMLSPESLRDLSEEGEGEYDYHESIRIEKLEDLPSIMMNDDEGSPIIGEFYRHLIIQVRPFLMVVMGHIIAVRPDLEPTDLWLDLEQRLVERGRQLKEMIDTIDVRMKLNGDDQEA
ncbi:MAG: hypothetical protein H0W65_09540 [Sphingomonas sp.]|uniref:hypothetical protein n=1 Tax=Sphingomonas sp. TaxID=28214 RepID=UPI0017D59965|nr:hypothetical protein [Sphingomonas sp.]MBA3667951.1 hypothetical protein [Sphingomonas sp.]